MAEENPREEILLDAKLSILEDGQGVQVQSLPGTSSFIDNKGRKCIKWRIKCDEYTRKIYNFKVGVDLNNNFCKELITLEQDIIPLNIFDDANRKFLYVKTLTGEETDLSQREKYLKDKLDFARREIILLKGQVISLTEQLREATLATGKFIAGGLEVVERAGSVAASMLNKSKEGEQK